jgi:hypothetical protein
MPLTAHEYRGLKMKKALSRDYAFYRVAKRLQQK